MFPEEAIQLYSYKGVRDYQDGGWLGTRGHQHWGQSMLQKETRQCVL